MKSVPMSGLWPWHAGTVNLYESTVSSGPQVPTGLTVSEGAARQQTDDMLRGDDWALQREYKLETEGRQVKTDKVAHKTRTTGTWRKACTRLEKDFFCFFEIYGFTEASWCGVGVGMQIIMGGKEHKDRPCKCSSSSSSANIWITLHTKGYRRCPASAVPTSPLGPPPPWLHRCTAFHGWKVWASWRKLTSDGLFGFYFLSSDCSWGAAAEPWLKQTRFLL